MRQAKLITLRFDPHQMAPLPIVFRRTATGLRKCRPGRRKLGWDVSHAALASSLIYV